ncbi:MAG TPA: prolyl oligopeptidase family serine peptidase [Gemmatimonadales bacterium]|nr:prolyl oligopeptidase family serine peptidase [Gemmatimonadales bacterium]
MRLLLLAFLATAPALQAQTLPLRQSRLDATARDASLRVPLDSTVDARWLGTAPGAPRWDLEGKWVYFSYDTVVRPAEPVAPESPWFRVSRDGKRIEAVDREAATRIPIGVQWTRDGSRAIWTARNELRIWERGKGERVLRAGMAGVGARWSNDETELRFLRDGDLFSLNPATGVERQLTRTSVKTEPPKDAKNAAELKRQQVELFDFVKRRKEQEDSSKARQRRDRIPLPAIVIKPKRDDTIGGVELTPDGKYVSYLVTPKIEEGQTIFGDYVNDSGIVIQRTSRAKVGAPLAQSRAAIIAVDPIAEPDSVKVTFVDTAGFGKPVRATTLSWNRQGTRLIAEFASLDYKDRWVVLVDPATGKQLKTLDHQHDDAWLLEPRGLTWMPDGERIAIRTEETGWDHLVLVSMDGTRRALTSGAWEVRAAALSRDGKWWTLSTSEAHPSELHLYRMPAEGGPRMRLDQLGEGEVTAVWSPAEDAMVLRWSTPRELTDLYLMPTLSAAPVRLTRSGTDMFYKLAWPTSDFVTFNDDQGKPVWARVYRPATQHANRPAVMEIHGAGYAQGVHKAFSGSSAHGGSLYAKHLTDLGVTYMVLDYRASAGYGRDVRTAVYRSMGDRDVASAVAAVPFLRTQYNVNPDRIGLYGCSYGGFFTLMALFKHPGTFKGGVAQCSVTDWAHYNHWYTARILNGAPASDSAAYRASSPIYHAEGLKDRLIIQHGLVDGNVQYQDAARLVQRLMELGKDFDFVTYPIEAHGWSTSWSKRDSQRRMQKLWEEVLLNR